MSILSRFTAAFRAAWRAVWNDYLHPALSLIMPRRCPICGDTLNESTRYVCIKCLSDVPLTEFEFDPYNQMEERVKALSPYVEHAAALIYYIKRSRWVRVIHNMKYRGEFYHAELLGEWLGLQLRRSNYYREIDCVVGVPLHPFRQMTRGYNQSDLIAAGCAKAMGAEAMRGVISRKRFNRAQVKTQRDNRWSNVDNLFTISNIKRLQGRNILIVDDVFTTGATILSCVEEIHKCLPDSRIWVATIAVAYNELGAVSR
ncbi:MAG: ComF family protein [Rikenellaceae bacterium]